MRRRLVLMALRSRCTLLAMAALAGVLVPDRCPASGQDSLAVDWSFLPFIIYNPETSLSLGALYARVAASPASPESVRTFLTENAQYTLKNQGVGGLRGIYETRYADPSGVLAVVELRRRLFWQMGGVAFGEGESNVYLLLGEVF